MKCIFPLLVVFCGCTGVPERQPANHDPLEPGVQEVSIYPACEDAAPGELIALPREVPDDLEPTAAAMREVVSGVSASEHARGCRSFFSSSTATALRGVHHSPGRDTVVVDFHDFSEAIPDVPEASSFLPPGVMAELTWTIFDQFPHIEAVRFSFDGGERAFWNWLGAEEPEPRAFTRDMWERI